jgi:hypothetical protein
VVPPQIQEGGAGARGGGSAENVQLDCKGSGNLKGGKHQKKKISLLPEEKAKEVETVGKR